MAVFYKYEYMGITKNIHPCLILNNLCNWNICNVMDKIEKGTQ